MQADLEPFPAAGRFNRKGIAVGNGDHTSFPGPGRHRQEKESKEDEDAVHGYRLLLNKNHKIAATTATQIHQLLPLPAVGF